MGSRACYAVSKATAGKIRNSGGQLPTKQDGTLILDRTSFDLVKWLGTAYIAILLTMIISFVVGWMIPFFIGLALYVLTYFATAFIIAASVCLSKHEDTSENRYTWKTGWNVFKRINTIMYLGFTLWFKTELKMM